MKKSNNYFTLIVLLALVVAFGFATPDTWAQRTSAQNKPEVDLEEDPEAGSASSELSEEEIEALRLRRRLMTSSWAELEVGEDKIVISTGIAKADGPDFETIAGLKDGEVLLLTRCQSVKLKTPVALKVGSVDLKTDNVAENYPGVYSIWLKKVGNGWNIVFNEKPDVWGTMYDSKADVGETPATYSKLDTPSEKLAFEIGDGMLSLKWGPHQWSSKFTIVN